MDFFDDVKATASDVGKTVKRYAETAIEVSKKKITVIDLKTKLNEAYKDLGKLCYRNSHSEEDLSEAINELIAEIDRINEAIKENN